MAETSSPERPVTLDLVSPRIDDREAFDCFNEDLVWILDKLVNRTGGVAGILSGHLWDDSHPTLLARSTLESEPSDLVSALISRATTAPECPNCDPDLPSVSHTLLNVRSSEQTARHYRLLQLSFSPTAGVKIVATVAKDSRRGFKFLEDAAALRLYPVLSRYLRLWWLHRAERRRAHAMSVIADMSDLAIVLLNHQGRVLFANSRAQWMLRARDGLTSDADSLNATASEDQERLAQALVRAQQANQAAKGIRRLGRISQILHMQRPGGGRNLIVAIMPVAPPAIDQDDTAVIVYALDPDQSISDLLAPVCDIYELTPTEARVVQLLVTGCRIADAAREMAIQPQTARAYLKRVFMKTRTHRQADLVRIMLSSALRTTATIDRPTS